MKHLQALAVSMILTTTGIVFALPDDPPTTPSIEWDAGGAYPAPGASKGDVKVKGKVTLPAGWILQSKKATVNVWQDGYIVYAAQVNFGNMGNPATVFEGGSVTPTYSGIPCNVTVEASVKQGTQAAIIIRTPVKTATPK